MSKSKIIFLYKAPLVRLFYSLQIIRKRLQGFEYNLNFLIFYENYVSVVIINISQKIVN